MSADLSLPRVGALVLDHWTSHWKPAALGGAAVLGVELLGLVFYPRILDAGLADGLWTWYVVIASAVIASGIFRPMQNGRTASDWLLLPASVTEKTLAAWVFVLGVVPLVLTVTALVGSVLTLHLWFPWSRFTIGKIGGFEVGLGILVAGSATFRKNPLWKTLLVQVAFVLVFTVSIAVAVGLRAGTGWELGSLQFHRVWENWTWGTTLASWWYFAVVPVFCLGYSWTRVREKEARDEVQ